MPLMSIDLDELIGISESQSKQAPVLWDKGEQEQELQKLVETHQLRLTQSTAVDVISSSLIELSTIAQTSPQRVKHLLELAIQTIARLMNTQASNSGFKFIRELSQDEECLALVLSQAGFLNICFEAARLFVATRTNFDQNAKNEALLYIEMLLDNKMSHDVIVSLLTRENQSEFYSTSQSLTSFMTHLLFSGDHQFVLLQKLLQIEIIDTFKDTDNTVSDIPLVSALLKSGFMYQIFQLVQQDKLSSMKSTQALKIMYELTSGVYGHQLEAINQVFRQQQLLHDLFHAVSYQYISQFTTMSSVIPQILLLVLQILLVEIGDKADEKEASWLKKFYSETKIFDFVTMIVCSLNNEQTNSQIQITALALELLKQLTKSSPETQTKLAITVTLFNINQTIEVPIRLAQIACSHPNTQISKESFQLLHNVFSENTQLGLALFASLSKPLRAARKGTWQDGIKLLLKTFALKIPGASMNQSQDPRYNAYTDLCTHVHRSDVDREFQVPHFDIGLEAAQFILNELLQGERYQDAGVLISRIIIHQKQTAMHFLGACLNSDQLVNVASTQNMTVDSVAYMLFKRLGQCEEARFEQIMNILCRAIVTIEGERVMQYTLGPMHKAEILCEQVMGVLVNKFNVIFPQIEGRLESYYTTEVHEGNSDMKFEQQVHIALLIATYLVNIPLKIYPVLQKNVAGFDGALFEKCQQVLSHVPSIKYDEVIIDYLNQNIENYKQRCAMRIDFKEGMKESLPNSSTQIQKEVIAPEPQVTLFTAADYSKLQQKCAALEQENTVLKSKLSYLQQSLDAYINQTEPVPDSEHLPEPKTELKPVKQEPKQAEKPKQEPKTNISEPPVQLIAAEQISVPKVKKDKRKNVSANGPQEVQKVVQEVVKAEEPTVELFVPTVEQPQIVEEKPQIFVPVVEAKVEEQAAPTEQDEDMMIGVPMLDE
ncbi:Conserved_hypothetical protein [Hexamita inflata]|uniref:Uncharacterized protein n=1 Tax=Hexamita inflata TaxID=28002 RepID=A0AA86U257_9EUKA|nr:Conserved hypothetical protein [Hexamita inflata]